MAEIKWFHIRDLMDPDAEEMYYGRLSDHRKAAADKCARRDDRLRSIAAGTLLEDALRERRVNHPFLYEYSDRGKPSVKNAPNLKFNLTHCKDYAAIALSSTDVGIDIEGIGQNRIAKNYERILHSRFVDEATCRWVMNQDPKVQEECFLRLWTFAEALGKASDTNILKITQLVGYPLELADGKCSLTYMGRKWNICQEISHDCMMTVAEEKGL